MKKGNAVDKNIERGGLYRNTISYFGGLIIIVSLVLILLFLLLSFSLKAPSPYIGIFTYLIFPALLTCGILIFIYGLFRESRRRRRLGAAEALPFPIINLNNPLHRKRFALILTGGSLLGILFAFVNYNAYLFTDSNTFCGRLCHSVMKPEYTAYLNGPHARVPCVDCHVGTGVSWYVKSKISGVPQVLAVWFNTYSRPIPVPIKNLRPARETCEECHWPQKFYGAQLMQYPYFRYNEQNTPEQISLLVRTGGGNPNLGEYAGIHWHMAISEKVYFKAIDPGLQQIPWIKVVLNDGSEIVFKDKAANLSDDELEKLPVHFMDCMDCHNRPSHVFLPPETAVDQAMAAHNIPPELPWIKKLALDALVKNYDGK
ncbi:MAG: cytochrome c3 family protein, partial [Syntrophales bacterium]